MLRPQILRLGLLLSSAALMAGACGGTAPASGGAVSAGATAAPVTAPPVAASVAPGGVLPSFAIPSFVGDAELAALIPTEIAGTPIETTSISGPEFAAFAGDDPEGQAELNAFLSGLNRSINDVSVAGASASIGDDSTSLSISAIRVRGADTGALLAGISQFEQSELDTPVTEQTTIGGKPVTVVSDGSDPESSRSYLYGRGDVVFQVETDDQAVLEETFSKLP